MQRWGQRLGQTKRAQTYLFCSINSLWAPRTHLGAAIQIHIHYWIILYKLSTVAVLGGYPTLTYLHQLFSTAKSSVSYHHSNSDLGVPIVRSAPWYAKAGNIADTRIVLSEDQTSGYILRVWRKDAIRKIYQFALWIFANTTLVIEREE